MRLVTLLASASTATLVLLMETARAQEAIDNGASVTVPGTHTSPWIIPGELFVGSSGAGALTIENGGQVTSNNAWLGENAGGSATVIVRGTGSRWTLSGPTPPFSGNLQIGRGGQATLTIEDGATVTATTSVQLGVDFSGNGTLTLKGTAGARGLLVAPVIFAGVNGRGTARLNLDGGVLQATSDRSEFLVDFDPGDVVIGNGGAFFDSNGYSIGVPSVLTGTGGLWKLGSGTLTLTGANTYSGETVVTGGTALAPSELVVSGPSATLGNASANLRVGASTGDVARLQISNQANVATQVGSIGDGAGSSGAVTVSDSGSEWNSGYLFVGKSGTGSLTIQGGGKVVTGNDTIIGDSSGSSGSVTVSGANSQLTSTRLYVGGSGTGALTIAKGGTVDISNELSVALNAGSVGTLNIGAASGDAAVDPGTLNAASVNFGSGAGAINFNHTATNYVFAPQITGSGRVNVLAGTTALTAANTYTGGTWLTGGTLSVAQDSNLGNGAGPLTFDGGTLQTTANFTTARSITLGAGGGTFLTDTGTTLTNTGTITGAGGLTKTGAGVLTLSGTNDYTGGTTINGGTLQVGANNNLGDAAGGLTLGGGTLRTTASFTINRATTLNASGGTFLTDAATTLTHTGTITGAGGLTKTGAGALTLSGTIGYGGATTVSGGTLTFTSDTAALTGAMTNNTAVVFNQAVDSSFAGNITGTGTLTKSSAGVLILSGTNAYTGGTTIDGGTLKVGTDNNLGGAAGVLTFGGGTLKTTASFTMNRGTTLNAGGGTLDVDAGATLSQQGVLTGAGQLIKAGGGTLMLTGVNSYSGNTTINAGTLIFAGNTSNLTGNIVNNAALVFDQATGSGVAGDITGTGTLTKSGAGILTLSGVNAYTGGTTVSGGTLRAGAAGAFVDSSAYTVNGGTLDLNDFNLTTSSLSGAGGTVDLGVATLSIDQAANTTYAGAITGTGGLTKSGAGNLNLTGTNTYTGPTAVNAGTLRVNGSLASAVTVGAAGTLGGAGQFLGGILNNGTLAPGNSIGTMHVTGPLTFNAGAVYQVEANAAKQADRVDVTGTATLTGAAVQVLPAPGNYAFQTEYTILTATDPITTAFAGITSASAFLDPTLLYGPNAVTLRLTRNNTSFASIAKTPNQRAVAVTLDAGAPGATGDLATVLGAALTLSAAQAQDAFDQLSGANLAAFPTPQLLGHARFDAVVRANALRPSGSMARAAFADTPDETRDAYDDDRTRRGLGLGRMAELGGLMAQLGPALSTAPADARVLGFWVSGYGVSGHVDGDGNAAAFNHRTGGVLGGIDYRLSASTTLGVALGYSRSELDHTNSGDEGEIGSVSASLYGVYRPTAYDGKLALDGALGFGRSDYKSTRHIAFAGLDRTTSGEHDGYDLSARLGASYRYDLSAWQIAPRADLGYVRLYQDGYSEKGADTVDLTVDEQDTESLQSRLGVDVARAFVAEDGMVWTPSGALGWRHEFADTDRVIDATLAGIPATAFRVAGADAARDALELGAGLSATTPSGTTWFVNYTADLADTETAHGLFAGIRLAW